MASRKLDVGVEDESTNEGDDGGHGLEAVTVPEFIGTKDECAIPHKSPNRNKQSIDWNEIDVQWRTNYYAADHQ